jgi:intracellular sulfur oxidation DsrE/DsrF family protein
VRTILSSLIDGADYNKVFSIETPLAETELSQGKLQKIRQASQILSAPNISIVGNGKNINLFVHDANNKSSDRFNILLGETDKTFTVATTIEQFKLLGDDYDLVISDGIIVKCVGNFVEYTLACDITVG